MTKEEKQLKRAKEWWNSLSFEAKWIMVIRFKNHYHTEYKPGSIGDRTDYPYCKIHEFTYDTILRLYQLNESY